MPRAKRKPSAERELRITYRRIDETLPDPSNPKEHDLGGLAESFQRFGYVMPGAINETTGYLLAGHGRRAKLLEALARGEAPPDGIKVDAKDGMWRWPVVEGVRLSKADGRAYVLADNRLVEVGGWNEPALLESVRQAAAAAQDGLAGTGFTPHDVERLARLHDPDTRPPADEGPGTAEIQALRKKWRTASGQLWTIASSTWTAGEHRLVIGDSTQAATWARLMAHRKAQCVYTDPPYGISYQDTAEAFTAMLGDDKRRNELTRFLTLAFKQAATHATDEAAFYIWHASETRQDFVRAMQAAGLAELQYLVWAKPAIVLGWADYRWAHEPCFYAAKAGHKPAWHGDRAQPTVWEATHVTGGEAGTVLGAGLVLSNGRGGEVFLGPQAPKRKLRHVVLETGQALLVEAEGGPSTLWREATDHKRLHPTQKPVALAQRAIANSTQAGEIVVDCFCGSGGTLVAAERLGRLGYGIELEPGYAAAVLERMSEMGLKPERQAAGR